jgi:SP family general alpha glucoside:H+ symporter-like MFS transporter
MLYLDQNIWDTTSRVGKLFPAFGMDSSVEHHSSFTLPPTHHQNPSWVMYQAPARKTVSQACDACRRRKVKCNGLQPCPGCISANLSCTFNVPQRKGGNRGGRATVLNELRAGKLQEDDGLSEGGEEMEGVLALEQSAQSLGELRNGLVDVTIDACIEIYLRRIQPVVPLLTAEVLREEALRTSRSLLSRQFITSFCAYVVTFGKVLDDPIFRPVSVAQGSEANIGRKLLEAALRIQNPERVSQPGRLSVYISFFLYGAHAGLGGYRQGWLWLREATTLFMMLKGGEEGEGEAYGRLFWVLVVSER